MKITIESTDRIVEVREGTHTGLVHGRVWQGKTESGIPVAVVITSLAVEAERDQSQFQAEFHEQHVKPEKYALDAFPLRFII